MRVLIVDDDATSRLMFKAVVDKLGLHCVAVVDGSSAWDLLQAEIFDVLITDWAMPEMTGPELIGLVRDAGWRHYTYAILITGHNSAEHMIEAVKAGADDFLTKPVVPWAIQARLIVAERVTTTHSAIIDLWEAAEESNVRLLAQTALGSLKGLSTSFGSGSQDQQRFRPVRNLQPELAKLGLI